MALNFPYIWGNGGGGSEVKRVRYYNYSGSVMLYEEYVESGWNARYEKAPFYSWATTPNGNAVSGITENITSDLDLYQCPSLDVDFSEPLLFHWNGNGTAGIDEDYTAAENETVLVINVESKGVGQNTHTTSAPITTTGTEIWKSSKTSDYVANISRECDLTLALITLEAGQKITLTNTHAATNLYYSQMHAIFKVNTIGTISDAYFATQIDNIGSDIRNYVPASDGVYLPLIIAAAPYLGQARAIVAGATAENYYNGVSDAAQYIAFNIGKYLMETDDSIIFSATGTFSYFTGIYAVWKITT